MKVTRAHRPPLLPSVRKFYGLLPHLHAHPPSMDERRGEADHAYGGAGVAALVSVEVDQQVGCAVAHHEVTLEGRVGVDHHQQLDRRSCLLFNA